jgi:phosphoribosylformylglycinamidine cyclo-ligase
LIDIAGSFNLEAKVIGRVEAAELKKLTIKTATGTYSY